MKKRLFPMILAMVLVLSPLVHAHQVPDLTKNGSITFELRYRGESVNGGTMELYRIGDILETDGNYIFALVPELADSGLQLDSIDDPALAWELAKLAKNAGLVPLSAEVEDGYAVFQGVTSGLYVVVQPEAANGFAPLDPFLISMPWYDGDAYITDVTARPKVPMETAPTEPTSPTEPTTPDGPNIPQTGQLNWPVPMLAALGLSFFAMGWMLCFGPNRKRTQQ